MFCVHARPISKVIASGKEFGMDIVAKKMQEGKWVKTMVRTLPNRFAMLEARSMEVAWMMLVMLKREPSSPSDMPNLRRK